MELLCHQQRRMTSVTWPAGVDDRLNILVRAAAAAGEHTFRAELLAAMVTTIETDPEKLTELIHRYRRLPANALDEDNNRDDLPEVRAPGPHRSTA
ncbi:hypothetical protein AB0J21_32735 [Streptomyces sp. NPDC049954]|uniref:hypothetical protein n=1 Tax=Streptomyces sp. NPDC049954 TaxID=3155779 RepID=UPI0034186C10